MTLALFLSSSDIIIEDGALTERLRGALQKLINGFDSHTCLHTLISADGGIGRHERLKISWPHGRAGSIPALRTN